MDYAEHLRKHQEKEDAARIAREKQREDEMTALQVACAEGEKIIRDTIYPELERLEVAL